MQESTSEQISALADDELDKPELGRALDRLYGQEALDAWERYHLIRDTVRGDLRLPHAAGVALAVRQQIDREPALHFHATPKLRFSGQYRRQATGMAIAASVTAVAILGVQALNGTSLDGAGKSQVADAQATNAPEPDPRLNVYLVEHTEYSASPGMRGMLPYVRIVSHR